MNWPRLAQNRLFDVAAIILALFSVARIATRLPARATQNDFAHYYVTSRLAANGVSPYGRDLAPEYARWGLVYETTVPSGTNPPPQLWLFRCFSWLPPRSAFWAWVGGQVCCLVAILALTRRLMGKRLSGRAWRLFCCGVVVSAPVHWHLHFSQMQLLLSALVLAGFAALQGGRPLVAQTSIAGAALLKLYPALLLPWFWAQPRARRWWWVPVAGAAAVIGVQLEWWLGVFRHGVPALASDALGRSFNFNVPALVATTGHLVCGLSAPASWVWGTMAGFGLLATAYWVCWRRGGDTEAEFCLLLIAMVLASGKASGTYLVWLVYPMAVAVARLIGQPTRSRIAGWSVAVISLNMVDTVSWGWLEQHLLLRILANHLPVYAMVGLGVWFAHQAGQAGLDKITELPLASGGAESAQRE
jgi:hypothetical protein